MKKCRKKSPSSINLVAIGPSSHRYRCDKFTSFEALREYDNWTNISCRATCNLRQYYFHRNPIRWRILLVRFLFHPFLVLFFYHEVDAAQWLLQVPARSRITFPFRTMHRKVWNRPLSSRNRIVLTSNSVAYSSTETVSFRHDGIFHSASIKSLLIRSTSIHRVRVPSFRSKTILENATTEKWSLTRYSFAAVWIFIRTGCHVTRMQMIFSCKLKFLKSFKCSE